MFKLTLTDGREVTAEPGQSLFVALRESGIFVPTICGGRGFCGKCKVQILEPKGISPTVEEQKHFSTEELEDGWHLACRVTVSSDMTISLPGELKGIYLCKGVVTERELVAKDIMRVRLELAKPLEYLPGAFAVVDGPKMFGVSRAYSIATPVSSRGAIELNVRLVPGGKLSTYVHEKLSVGEELSLTAPYSGYAELNETDDLLCVAGGSGISPVMSLLRTLKENGFNRKVTFIYGANTVDELPYLDELLALQASEPNFVYYPAIATAPTEPMLFQYDNCLVTDAITKHMATTDNVAVYLCGSAGMIAAVTAVLNSKGSPKSIFYDKFN